MGGSYIRKIKDAILKYLGLRSECCNAPIIMHPGYYKTYCDEKRGGCGRKA